MELKEYIKIFKKNYRWFLLTIVFVLLLATSFKLLWGTKYQVELDLNITRSGYQNDTNEYRYDEFYRLQADERFADTVVRWLGSKRIREDIITKSGDAKLLRFKSERLSSQMIRVSFLIEDRKQAQNLADSIARVLSDKTEELNKEQKNPNWFKILISTPVVEKYEISWMQLILLSSLVGLFLGFWVVLIKNYWE